MARHRSIQYWRKHWQRLQESEESTTYGFLEESNVRTLQQWRELVPEKETTETLLAFDGLAD